MIGLLPIFISKKLSIENLNYISNKGRDKMIQLHILNRHFCNTINIKKPQELAYIFLINQKSCYKLVIHIIFIIYNFLCVFLTTLHKTDMENLFL